LSYDILHAIVKADEQVPTVTPKFLSLVYSFNSRTMDTQADPASTSQPISQQSGYIGGGEQLRAFNANDLVPYVINYTNVKHECDYQYVQHGTESFLKDLKHDDSILICNIPLSYIAARLTRPSLLLLAKQHGFSINTKTLKRDMVHAFLNTNTYSCEDCVTAFHPVSTHEAYKHNYYKNVSKNCSKQQQQENKFPPLSPTSQFSERIIKSFTDATDPSQFEECGCAVCGELSLRSKITRFSESNIDLDVLVAEGCGFTRKE
jgi:hypothetical protein